MARNPSLDGIELDLEFVDDGFEKSLVRHEFPFRPGALLEDMGFKARTVSFKAYFIDETYDAHIELLNKLLTSKTDRVFYHPAYGELIGDVEKVSCRHDDSERTAVLDITFVEGLIEKFGKAETDKASITDAVSAQAKIAATARYSKLKDMMGRISTVYGKAKQYQTQITNKLTEAAGRFENLMTEVSNPDTSFTSFLNFASGLPGRFTLAVAQAVERYSVAYTTLKSAPATFLRKLDEAGRELAAAFEGFGAGSAGGAAAGDIVYAILKMSFAEQVALSAAEVYTSDQELRDASAAAEKTSVIDGAGQFVLTQDEATTTDDGNATPTDIMTVNELEETLALSRTALQAAVDAARVGGFNPQPYKNMAGILTAYVDGIKLQRERIVQVTVDVPTPLHLICLRYGLPHAAAPRILAINKIPNPNEVCGTINIYTPEAA